MGLSYSPDRSDADDVSYTGGSITVGTSQVLACSNGSSNQAKRQELLIYNKSTATIYFGPSGVTTSTGVPIEPQGALNLPFTDNINVYLIAGSAGNTVIVQELS